MLSWWLLTWAKIRHVHDSSELSVAQNQLMHESFYLWLQYTSVYFLCACLAQAKGSLFNQLFISAGRLWSINTTRLIKTIVFQIHSMNKAENLSIPYTQEGSFDRQDRAEELLLKPVLKKLRIPCILILTFRKSYLGYTTYYEGFADFMSSVT